jgi:hypothetical protein
MVKKMIRLFALMLSLSAIVCSFTQARADGAGDKPVASTADPAVAPKIRVILPALWEPATPQAASQAVSPQRSAAR